MLSETGDYKPNQSALKPMFAWINAMKKRKHDVSKKEDDLCKIPAAWMPHFESGDAPSKKP